MFTTSRWNGPGGLVGTFAPVDRLFRELTTGWPLPSAAGWSEPRAFPALNIWEDDETLTIEAEVPGLGLDDLDLVVVGDELTIRGSRKAQEVEGSRYHRRERGVGVFGRLVHLPYEVEANRVEASLKNGVLLIKLPKAVAARPRKVEVKHGGE